MFYDLKKQRGYLYNKIRYRKYGKTTTKRGRKSSNDYGQREVSTGIEVMTLETINENQTIDESEILLFFRTCVLDRDLETLKMKLVETIELRENVIKKKNTIFYREFPFYFYRPDLVTH